jgi:hypothetical protein
MLGSSPSRLGWSETGSRKGWSWGARWRDEEDSMAMQTTTGTNGRGEGTSRGQGRSCRKWLAASLCQRLAC